MSKARCFAYYRTSSATNVGTDKDSEKRQREAVVAYAKANRLDIAEEFYDAAVSGADPIDQRPEFARLLERSRAEGVSTVLVENASRFARDLAVQLTGHALMQRLGIELVPVDAPTYFSDPTPTAVLVRQILGAVSEFDRASLVLKLRGARDRVRKERGRCEGRKPVPDATILEAKRLARVSPKTHKRRSLQAIAAELAAAGHVQASGKPYFPFSVSRMLAKSPHRQADTSSSVRA